MFYPTPPKTTKVIYPDLLLEKGITLLTMWSVVILPLQYLAPAVETEGGPVVWYCRPGQRPKAGVVLSQNVVTACILFNGHDILCIVPVKHLTFIPRLNGGNLFMDWAKMVASL